MRALSFLLLSTCAALAQGNPGFIPGAELCANTGCSSQAPINPLGLNQAFMTKQDAGGFNSPITFTDGTQTILDYNVTFPGNEIWALQRRMWYFTPGTQAAAVAALTPYNPAIGAYNDYSNPGAVTGNTIIAYHVNNSSNVNILPVALGGVGVLQTPGSQETGIFGAVHMQTTGVGYHNSAIYNETGSPPDPNLPPNTGFQPPAPVAVHPMGFLFSCGGSKGFGCSLAAGVVKDGLNGQPFLTGYYTWPDAVSTNGIYIDATATQGPAQSMILKNTGQGTNVAASVYTVGPEVPTNKWFQHVNVNTASPIVSFDIMQNGTVTIGGTAPSNNYAGYVSYIAQNLDPGATSGTNLQLTSNAGQLLLQADSQASAAGPSDAIFRWTGAGPILFDAFNATGTISFRTGAGPAVALSLGSSQGVQMPGLPASAGGGGLTVCVDNTGLLYKKASCP